MKIGITGNTGFIGTHLTNYLQNKGFDIVPFEKEYFLYQDKLNGFVRQCNAIIHLAGRSKPHDRRTVFNDNLNLTDILISSFINTGFNGHLIFVSSIHESEQNYYAKSKKRSRHKFGHWAENEGKFTGLILPNVFGSCTRIENSFIAKFCWQLFKGEEPKIFKDVEIELIYIDELMSIFKDVIKITEPTDYYLVKPTSKNKLSHILHILKQFPSTISNPNTFDLNLYETWKRNLAIWQS